MKKDSVPVLKKRFKLPSGMSCKEFVMRELTAKDEIEAAIWADQKRSSAGDGVLSMVGGEQREAMRLALVEVDGETVNVEGVPFTAMDRWTYRTMRYLQKAFEEINGVDQKDLASFSKGAEIVDDPMATEAPQAEATTGK
jgi:phage FluMu protein gp41